MLKFLEFVPIIVFFSLYKLYNIFVATVGIGIASVVTAAVEYLKNKKISRWSLINLLTLLLMGSMTILLEDVSFIKMKPTIIYSGIAIFLIIDLMILKKFFVQKLYASLVDKELTDATWKRFSIHWVILLISIAIANEVIWRQFSEDYWVNFKVFIVPLILISMILFHVVAIRKKI